MVAYLVVVSEGSGSTRLLSLSIVSLVVSTEPESMLTYSFEFTPLKECGKRNNA